MSLVARLHAQFLQLQEQTYVGVITWMHVCRIASRCQVSPGCRSVYHASNSITLRISGMCIILILVWLIPKDVFTTLHTFVHLFRTYITLTFHVSSAYIGCSERRLTGHSFYRRNFLRKSCATCREKCRRAALRTEKSDKPAQ
jgi:hypothetical protein